MLLAAAAGVAGGLGSQEMGLPRACGIGLVLVGLLCVVYVGHRAAWQSSPSARGVSAGAVVSMALLVVLVLVMSITLTQVSAPAGIDSLVRLSCLAYATLWMVRGLVADSPRVRAAQAFLWLMVSIGFVLIGFYAAGLRVGPRAIGDFYSTTAEVDAALLLAAAFQSAWARRVKALEGMVLVTVGALALSLACSLVVLGRGGDSANLFAYVVGGLAAGTVLVGVGVVRQIAPDLFRDLAVRGDELLIADELRRCDWSVSNMGRRRGFGYDIRAVRAGRTIFVAVTSSPVAAEPKLTAAQWKRCRRERDAFVLAVVDYLGSEWQSSWFVRDPIARVAAVERAVPAPKLHRPWLEQRGVQAGQL